MKYFAHESAVIDEPASIGDGTRIWHYSHICADAEIGENCTLGQNVMLGPGVRIGNNVKIQNNVSVYSGVTVEDNAFLGPSCVFTNISNPRSEIVRRDLFESTLVRRGATIGANSTIICGVVLGRYCFVSAGSVVTKSVSDYALIKGLPARQAGWMSRHGHPLDPGSDGLMVCPESGYRYTKSEDESIWCLDLDEEAPLPEEMRIGRKGYRDQG